MTSFSWHLSIYWAGRPRIIKAPKDVTVVGGSHVTLECVGSGNPQPAVQWTRNDLPLPSESRFVFERDIGRLHIKNITIYDRGVYRCIVTNSLDTVSASATVNIQGDVDKVIVQGQNIIIVHNLTWQNKFAMIMILLLKIQNEDVVHWHVYT